MAKKMSRRQRLIMLINITTSILFIAWMLALTILIALYLSNENAAAITLIIVTFILSIFPILKIMDWEDERNQWMQSVDMLYPLPRSLRFR